MRRCPGMGRTARRRQVFTVKYSRNSASPMPPEPDTTSCCGTSGRCSSTFLATFAVLDRAGHALPHEQPGLIHALVAEWLDRVHEHPTQFSRP